MLSKTDRSEGQKNRLHREAIERMQWIAGTLNPEEFSFQELEDEGGTNLSDESLSDFKRHLTTSLRYLVILGYVEVLDEEDQTYRLVMENIPADML